jgi:hypothetical protein
LGATQAADSFSNLAQDFLREHESIEGIGDLTDFRKFSKSYYQLLGRMTPSLAAAGTTALVTRGAGMGTFGSMISSSFAAFMGESLDMAGTIKREIYDMTGDQSKADVAESEMWRGQMMIMPLYAFESLPFFGSALKGLGKLGKVGKAARIPTAGAIEFFTELPQEVRQ